jgi:hypothetical protein
MSLNASEKILIGCVAENNENLGILQQRLPMLVLNRSNRIYDFAIAALSQTLIFDSESLSPGCYRGR